MKIIANKTFMDKVTKQTYKPGDVVEVSDKRGKEILADKRGLASLVEDGVHAEEKKPKKKKTTK